MASISKQLSIAYQVRRINRELLTVAAKVEEPVSQTVFTQAALLASEIKSGAPVDETSENPGALKDSVRVERGKANKKQFTVARVIAGGPATRKASASGPEYDYARAVEFGTQDMEAKPFFYPPARARKKDIKAAIKKATNQGVKRVFK